MSELATILQQPITQFGIIVGTIIGLQKAGVDVGALFRGFLGIRSADIAKGADTDTKKTLETMVYQMSELSNHFNHETTSELENIHTALEKISERQEAGNEILRAIDKYGIKCRKE